MDFERLGAYVVLFHEVPVGFGHPVGVEERLRTPVGRPITCPWRVDLTVDDDVGGTSTDSDGDVSPALCRPSTRGI